MKRTLVIGDIHGGYKALTQVLDRVNVTQDDSLIFIGDYVDGWSGSAQVMDFLIELAKKINCRFIKGNHDVWCAQWLQNGIINPEWFEYGGRSTIESYKDAGEELSETKRVLHLDFFNKLEDYIIDDQKRLFVHAGFTSLLGPAYEENKEELNLDRSTWETAMALAGKADTPVVLPERLKLFKEIFIGHTPTIKRGWTVPTNAMNVWNADTGAGKKGKLSVLDIDTKQYWQSDVVRELYPDEKGRNDTSYKDSH